MSLVRYEVQGAVGLITLDRPPVNAISEELISDLQDAIGRAGDEAVRAVVVTGSPSFAAGADITGFQAAFDAGQAGEPHGLASLLAGAVRSLELLPKPVISAVSGVALGGGLELAMGADFIYMADDARVGQPEIKLGIIPGAGGTQRLPRLVGFAKAKELNYSGRFVGAEEALEIGLASKVVPAADLLDVAMTDAADWATGPTVAISAAKQAMNEGFGRPIDEALAAEAAAFAGCFVTADAREGVAAFLEKRSPNFVGR